MPSDSIAVLAVATGALAFGSALSGMAALEGDLAAATATAGLRSQPVSDQRGPRSAPADFCREPDTGSRVAVSSRES